MADPAHLLPPNATPLERALSVAPALSLEQVPVAIDTLWNPWTIDASLLPWLAWQLSIDIWDSAWSEAEKRAAIADAIAFQRRKGTPASLRTVLDRFDPMIQIVEWFRDRETLDPYTFRLELPLLADSDIVYDDLTVAQILRDIAQVKPVRADFTAVYRMQADVQAWLVSASGIAGQGRLDERADTDAAQDPIWDSYLQTEQGEPILAETRAFLEH